MMLIPLGKTPMNFKRKPPDGQLNLPVKQSYKMQEYRAYSAAHLMKKEV